jgi:hypothetical protein
MGPTFEWLFFPETQVGVLKSRQLRLPRLWSPITLRANFGSRCGLKQSCSSRQELSNGMSHVFWRQVNRVDSLLLAITCVSDVQMSNASPFNTSMFQELSNDIKNASFDLWNRSLKFRKSTGTPSPKVGVALGVWGFTPSHFLTLPGICDVTPGLPLGPQPCNPFALVANPKLRCDYMPFHVPTFLFLIFLFMWLYFVYCLG